MTKLSITIVMQHDSCNVSHCLPKRITTIRIIHFAHFSRNALFVVDTFFTFSVCVSQPCVLKFFLHFLCVCKYIRVRTKLNAVATTTRTFWVLSFLAYMSIIAHTLVDTERLFRVCSMHFNNFVIVGAFHSIFSLIILHLRFRLLLFSWIEWRWAHLTIATENRQREKERKRERERDRQSKKSLPIISYQSVVYQHSFIFFIFLFVLCSLCFFRHGS